jgi:L-lysine exporter family protein LysE/ArgO
MLTAFLQGFGLDLSLIVAIGAQNAFVLRQGLRRTHVFATALVSSICDVTLIVLGVGGVSSLLAIVPVVARVATAGGALFLFYYGLRSFRSALIASSLNVRNGVENGSRLRETVLTALALSLLNPHVWLDTVVLVGTVGTQFPPRQRVVFTVGAGLGSTVWFFALAYGASQLWRFFERPTSWRILDTLIGCIMWTISFFLVRSLLQF